MQLVYFRRFVQLATVKAITLSLMCETHCDESRAAAAAGIGAIAVSCRDYPPLVIYVNIKLCASGPGSYR